jgi:creatinine amidohydrolase
MLVELCRSAAATFRHILLISLYSGNDKVVTGAVERLRADHLEVIAWMPAAVPAVVPAALMDPDPRQTANADPGISDAVPYLAGRAGTAISTRGRFETALQLALDPHRVHVSLEGPGNAASLPELTAALSGSGVRGVSANGVLGDPTGASADDGDQLLKSLDSQLLAVVSHWMLAL